MEADIVCSGRDDDKEKTLVLSVLYQIKNIKESFYWSDFNDSEEDLMGIIII